MGLDQNDTIVRRRLAQKLTFLIDDTSRIVEPTEEELRRFSNAHAERFQMRRAYPSPNSSSTRKGDSTRSLTRARRLCRFRRRVHDAVSVGDPILLENEFREVDEQTVSNVFGADFARAVFLLKPGSWAGPVKSGYGVHLVGVTDLRPATSPV